MPLSLEADLARTELLTSKRFVIGSGIIILTARGVTKISLTRGVLIFSYMPGIAPKLNTLWRFNVNSVSHFFRHHTIVVQMVFTPCFAGHVHVSVEPCLSTRHVTFFCAGNFGFIFISASLSSTSVVISSSLIFHSFVRIFSLRFSAGQWWCVRPISTPSPTWCYACKVNQYTIGCLRGSDFYCLPSA